MRYIRITLFIVSLCLFNTGHAQTPIHKCTDADGGVVYSQLPCSPPKPDETKAAKKTEPVAEAEPPALAVVQEEPEVNTDSAACKKRYRDAIDVIDAEIGRDYSPANADEYKQQLLNLTRKLRQC